MRGDMLSEVALECGLPDYLLLGPGELKSVLEQDLQYWRML